MKSLRALALLAITGLMLAACAPSGADATPGPGDDVEFIAPPEAANTPNPIAADETSIAAGAEIFANNCATCHGPEGFGDGPAGATLDPHPANLHNVHIQEAADGTLFWIVSNGVEGTAMPAWGEALSEEERWNVINFVKSLE